MSQLLDNTTSLQNILDMVNSLPDAGSGGSGNSGSSSPVYEKDVNFYDYDGTLLYSYTVEEAQALTELPAGPEHDGLVFQKWNWSLESVNALTRAMNIGAMYTTDDGTTRLYIHLEEGRTSPMLGVCPNGTVTVDWGDGTDPDTLTGTSISTVKWTPTHEYSAPGDYVIRLTVNGTMGFTGSSSANMGGCIIRYGSTADGRNYVYLNALQRMEIGYGVTSIGNYTFDNCFSLASVAIPDGVTSIGNNAFRYCYGMRFYDFSTHTSVPTLSSTNAFNSMPADCEIRVPSALYDEWIAATNWATYADYIVAV